MKTIQDLEKDYELAIADWMYWDMNDEKGYKKADKRMQEAKEILQKARKDTE